MSVFCCNEKTIHMMQSEKTTRAAILQREAELKKAQRTPRQRDEILINEFLGYVKLDRKHVVFAYFTGKSRDRKELIRLENWRIVHRDHLVLFQSHLNDKHFTESLYKMTLSDIPSTSNEQNIAIDVRFIVNKWYNANDNDEMKALLLAHKNDYTVGQDYLINLTTMKATTTTQKKKTKKNDVMELIQSVAIDHRDDDAAAADDDDPYQVKDDAFRRVTKEEYIRLTQQPIDDSIHFDFMRFTEVSRRSFVSKKTPRPESHYVHDPIALFDAVVIATNIDGMARRSASMIPHKHHQVIENNDVTKVIDFMSQSAEPVADMHAICEEYLFALMAVDHATRSLRI